MLATAFFSIPETGSGKRTAWKSSKIKIWLAEAGQHGLVVALGDVRTEKERLEVSSPERNGMAVDLGGATMREPHSDED